MLIITVNIFIAGLILNAFEYNVFLSGRTTSSFVEINFNYLKFGNSLTTLLNANKVGNIAVFNVYRFDFIVTIYKIDAVYLAVLNFSGSDNIVNSSYIDNVRMKIYNVKLGESGRQITERISGNSLHT